LKAADARVARQGPGHARINLLLCHKVSPPEVVNQEPRG
jgi:hypothetical protein